MYSLTSVLARFFATLQNAIPNKIPPTVLVELKINVVTMPNVNGSAIRKDVKIFRMTDLKLAKEEYQGNANKEPISYSSHFSRVMPEQ